MTKADLILHPVRLRILITIGQNEKTVAQIASLLPDIAQATLYRHINTLVEGRILTVTHEKPIRGTVERTYALTDMNAASLTAEDITDVSKEEHLRYFTMFTALLLSSFSRYLDNYETPDFAADGTGYHIHELYLSPEEEADFAAKIRAAIAPHLEPAPDRKRKIFSTVIMPGDIE